MAIIAKASAGGGDIFTPAPVGMHRAICCDVVDLGVVTGQFGPKHLVRIVWQTEAAMPDGKPYLIDRRYTLSLDERSKLRPMLEAWRGKPFTLQEAAGFDLERLVGVECALMVIHEASKTTGKIFANIQAVIPKMPGARLQVRDYVRVIDREHGTPQPVGPSFAPPPTGYVALAGPTLRSIQQPAPTYQAPDVPPPPTFERAPAPVDADPFGGAEPPPLADEDIPF